MQWEGREKISHLFNKNETKWSKTNLFAYLCCFKSSIRVTMIENNNVYKTRRKNGNKEYYIFLTSDYFAISMPILLFSCSFHIPSIILSNVYFYIVRSIFPFLFNRSQSTANIINQLSHLFFWNSKIFFCSFQIFNVVSTLINVLKLDAQNNNILSTFSNVVNINVEIDNVNSTLFLDLKVDLTLSDVATCINV